ncbi:MAG: nuclear transport factor 2 family protein [Flavobacteriaceae bacterium]|nr:nuclear transport factor 2 family protein [Flavobacteriaceae bacterium]
MDAEKIADRFYTAFAKGDAETMTSLYAEQIEFEDPAFGKLKNDRAKMMWSMLLERSQGNLKIEYRIIESTEKTALVNWEARYPFSKTGRQIHNKISAHLTIEDGKIIKHTDHFNLWKWSQQALGFKGLLMGWTPFFRKKLQQQTRGLLEKYMN